MRDYQERYMEVLNYIEANLNYPLDIKQLCQLTHLSEYHFHRQCSAFFGLTIMSLVKLLKLKRAAYQLVYRNDKKVVDIALANGYESHEAFSRAFKKHFLKTPSKFRKLPDWTPWHSQYDPILKLRSKMMNKKIQFNPKIIDFPELLLAAIEHRGSPASLGKSIAKFIQWRKENNLPPSRSRTFNLVYNDPSTVEPEAYRCDIACTIKIPLEDTNQGILNKVIPSGKCAVVRHIGSDDSIGVVVNYLYREWLLDSKYETRNFTLFFERISFFPDVPENEMVTDIYLPIE